MLNRMAFVATFAGGQLSMLVMPGLSAGDISAALFFTLVMMALCHRFLPTIWGAK